MNLRRIQNSNCLFAASNKRLVIADELAVLAPLAKLQSSRTVTSGERIEAVNYGSKSTSTFADWKTVTEQRPDLTLSR